MPALTPCASLPYPVPSDPPDVAGDFKRLADAIDAYVCAHSGKAVGEVFAFWDMGKGYPDGALVCDGSTFSPTTYPLLNAWLGGNQLPDLRGRFLMGANPTFPVRTPGGFTNTIPVTHDHGLPNHNHTMLHNHVASTGGESGDHAHGISFMSGGGGAHNHGVAPPGNGIGLVITTFGAGGLAGSGSQAQIGPDPFYAEGDHQHAINGATGGRNAGHTHTVTVNNSTVATGDAGAAGRTSAEGSDGTNRNLPPFFAVTYLMQAR